MRRLEKLAAITTNSGGDFKRCSQIFLPAAFDWGWFFCKLFNELHFLHFIQFFISFFFGWDSLSQGRGCRGRKLGWAKESAPITGQTLLFGGVLGGFSGFWVSVAGRWGERPAAVRARRAGFGLGWREGTGARVSVALGACIRVCVFYIGAGWVSDVVL